MIWTKVNIFFKKSIRSSAFDFFLLTKIKSKKLLWKNLDTNNRFFEYILKKATDNLKKKKEINKNPRTYLRNCTMYNCDVPVILRHQNLFSF